MVQLFEKSYRPRKDPIKADIIILGCSLSGIVTAHKLKKRFGNTMDIVVLDLASNTQHASKCNVAFHEEGSDSSETESDKVDDEEVRKVTDGVARRYLARYAKEFELPLPDAIIAPEKEDKSQFSKLFQHKNGSAVHCPHDYHNFDYLSFIEKFELDQYQSLLERCMNGLFRINTVNFAVENKRLLYYDQTPMEIHICNSLIFPTSREIMRTTVRLVCGAPANIVSVLFYLHQCYRTSGARNHLDGNNTRFREKLLGYCRKRLSNKLQKSIADITKKAKSINKIRMYSDEQVILESTVIGDSNYVCNLLAMALRPDELHNIRVEDRLLSEEEAARASRMRLGRAKKFSIQYEECFWRRDGYSGDIVSIQGPIIWAMERPKMSTTGSMEKYAALVGYLKVHDDSVDSKEAVVDQLVKLFGDEAAIPVSYTEKSITGSFIPRCGDYVALSMMIGNESPKYLEWGAFDIFADGDFAAALEAGHTAYLHLLSCLRPQAQTYEDMTMTYFPSDLESPLQQWLANHQVMGSIRLIACATAVVVGFSLIRTYLRR